MDVLGSSLGNRQVYRCPPNQMLTGITGNGGAIVDSITGMYCATTDEVLAGSSGAYTEIKSGGNGGSLATVMCPPRTGAIGLRTRVQNDDRTPKGKKPVAIGLMCVNPSQNNISRSGIASSQKIGRSDTDNNVLTKVGQFLSGINVWANQYINGIQGIDDSDNSIDPRVVGAGALIDCDTGARTTGCALTNSDEIARAYKTFCTNTANVKNANCIRWCKDNRAACESSIREYCKNNPSDPYCSCINSKSTKVMANMNPACIDAECIQNGFITADMATMQCPPVITCEVHNNMLNAGIKLGNPNYVNMNCGIGANYETTTREITQSGSGSSGNNRGTGGTESGGIMQQIKDSIDTVARKTNLNPMIIYAIIGILFLIIVLLIAMPSGGGRDYMPRDRYY